MSHPEPERRTNAPPGTSLLAGLTPEQAQAVTHGTGPLLLIAGPGAGKTRTLIHRIAHLLRSEQARPQEILAVTFSVRAAGELRLRLADLLGQDRARAVTAATFHSVCARLLREHAQLFGRTERYTIYDQGDMRRVVEYLLSQRNETDLKRSESDLQQILRKGGQPSVPELLTEISFAKTRLLTPETYSRSRDHRATSLVAALWVECEAELTKSNAFDFDDLLAFGTRLLREHSAVARWLRSRWRWVLVDEYQDANHAQVILTSLLAGPDGNVSAVADDDQCLVAGTPITMADGTRKPIEQITPGDRVLSAHGGGRLGPSLVLRVRRSNQHEGIAVTTAAGRRLVSTPEHIHFAGYQLYGSPQMYLTYAMCKGRHFRLGTTSVYTDAKVKRIWGLQNRCAGEHADAAWVVSTHESELEARIAELRLSLQYGLPLLPFVARPGRAERGCSIVGNQAALDQLFNSLDTWSAGLRLLADHGLSLSYPHQLPQSAEGRRRNIVVTLCKDDRAHLVSICGSDPAVERVLKEAGYNPSHSKRTSPHHWSVKKQSTDLGVVLGHAERIRDLTGARIRLMARVGPTAKTTERATLPLMPASAVRAGMVMATEDSAYDTVVSVESGELDGPVFDLDVEGTHNFVAEGIITHNCVYSWRGADARHVVEFARQYPQHSTIGLVRNFRSRAEILDVASRCVAHNQRRVQKTLVAVRGAGGHVHVRGFHEDWHEAHWVAGQIAEAIAAGIPGPEILILARTGYATQAVQVSLARAGIRHRVLGSLGLYERTEVKDALAYLTLLVNPADAQAFRRAIQSPKRGVGPATASHVVARAREAMNGDLVVACNRVDEIDGVRSGEARQRLAAFGEGMSAVREDMTGGRSLGHVVLAAVMLSGGLVQHFEQRRDRSPNAAARRDAERVLEDLRSLCRAAQVFEQEHGPSASLGDFLEHAIGLHAQEIDAGEDRRVTVSTIHRAKGTEATLVILLGCEEQLLPSWQSLGSPDPEALCEERRLFYVAATRAKDRLILTHVRTRAGRDTAGPSRFLYEAGLLSRPTRQAA
jgi:DNA helicase-2/ATP-dependent DNA helicase PcrA